MKPLWSTFIEKFFCGIQSNTNKMLLLCVISFFILFCGCQSPSPTSSDSDGILSLTIDRKQDNIAFPLSEITEKVDVIELELNEESLISEIRDVYVLSEHYIISDVKSIGVLVYDKQGHFVRRIGKKGQGPGEFPNTYTIQIDHKRSTISFSMINKVVIYDIHGNLIEEKKINGIQLQYYDYLYYLNDSLFIIRDKTEKDRDGLYHQSNYFNIFAYSNENDTFCLVDSILIIKHNPIKAHTMSFQSVFQHQNQVYMFYASYEPGEFIYVIKNHQFVPFARLKLTTTMRGLNVTDRYVIAIHGALIGNTSMPRVITPDMRHSINNQTIVHNFSYYAYDLMTGKSIDSYHGFIDDIHHTNDTVRIKVIDGSNMFYYTREHEYSEALKAEPNPTLYIGTFKIKP